MLSPKAQEALLDSLFLGKYAGRCIVMGGGPSVRECDPALLKGERLIGVNVALHHPLLDCVRDSFVAGVVLDHEFLVKHIAKYAQAKFPVFSGNTPDDSHRMLEYLNALGIYRIPSNYTEGLGDCFGRFSNGGNSGFAAIQLAIILGFTDIGLLGFDGLRPGTNAHFHDEYAAPSNPAIYNQWLWVLDSYHEVFSVLGIKITVLSRLNPLRCFPGVLLQDWLSQGDVAHVPVGNASQGRSIHLPFQENEPPGEWGYYDQINACYGGAVNAVMPKRYGPVHQSLRPYIFNNKPEGAVAGRDEGVLSERRPREVAICSEANDGYGEDVCAIAEQFLTHGDLNGPKSRCSPMSGIHRGGSGSVHVIPAEAPFDSSKLGKELARPNGRGLTVVCLSKVEGREDVARLVRLLGDRGIIVQEYRALGARGVLLIDKEGGRSSPQEEYNIFLGSEPRMKEAEKILRYSIRKHCSPPVTVTTMDYSLGKVWQDWETGAKRGTRHGREQGGWFTDFTNFRWAIPEVCGFRGHAIYLDVDTLVLRDLRGLLAESSHLPVLAHADFSVMLMNCGAFRALGGWPSITQMKSSGWNMAHYTALLQKHRAIGRLGKRWNCCDGEGFDPQETAIVHYRNMSTQPWRPYPDEVVYRQHPCPAVEDLWFAYAQESFQSTGAGHERNQ